MQKTDFNDKMDNWSFGEGNEVTVLSKNLPPVERRYISVVTSAGYLSSELIQLCAIHYDIDYELY